jgi:hypothetical protein
MIREGIRMKIALIFIVVLVVILPVLPFSVHGDGVTLKSRIQMFLSFSLSSVSFLLSMLTIFLACGSLSNEIREKHIQMIAVKPIARWQFVLGKWLGIAALDTAMLAGCGLVIYGFSLYLKTLPPANALDEYGVNQEVFAARGGVPLRPPDMTARVEETIRQLRSEGRLTVAPGQDLSASRQEIRRQLEMDYLSVPPRGQSREYVFKNLLVDRSPGNLLYIRYKAAYGEVPHAEIWQTGWIVGDANAGTRRIQLMRKDPSGQANTVPVPTDCVAEDGTLKVEVYNFDPNAVLSFTGEEGTMEVLFHIGGFGWNLTRGLILVGFRLIFLAAVGILFSSFLSFPVACMATLLVFFVAISAGFLGEALAWVSPEGVRADPLWVLGPPLRLMARGFIWLVPDLAKFDPVPTIVDGRVVTLMWLIVGAVQLIITRALVIGFLACVVFTKRELAQVTA